MTPSGPSYREVAAGVYAVDHAVLEGKCAVAVGEARALAVDGGAEPAGGQGVAALIRDLGREPGSLALTHGHGDHVGGGAPLGGSAVFAHAQCRGVMERQVAGLAQRWGVSEAAAAARLPWPTVTFEQEIGLDLGGRRVRLVPTPGHSPDSISVFVEGERVVVTGDAVFTCLPPMVGGGNSRVLEASLRRLLDLEAEVLIPGHGPVLEGGAQVRDWLCWQMGYLARARRRVRQLLVKGVEPPQAAAAAGFEEMVGERLRADQGEAASQHAATVQKIVEEEVARLP